MEDLVITVILHATYLIQQVHSRASESNYGTSPYIRIPDSCFLPNHRPVVGGGGGGGSWLWTWSMMVGCCFKFGIDQLTAAMSEA